jgi:hypothetical protein
MSGVAGAVMQPARRRQIEVSGVAARFQKHGREAIEKRRLLGDPKRIGKLVRLRDEQAGRVDAK